MARKLYPNIGDIIVVQSTLPEFISPEKYNGEGKVLGVVYDIQGNKIRYLNGSRFDRTIFGNCLTFAINNTNVPSESGTFDVYLLKKTDNNKYSFTYTRNTGSIDEFTTQLSNFFSSNNLTDWSIVTYDNSKYIVFKGIFSDYTSYDFFLGDYSTFWRTNFGYSGTIRTTGVGYNQIKQGRWACGMNRKRIEEYSTNDDSDATTPSDPSYADGVTSLYQILPVNKNYYRNSSALRSHYESYSDYLDACMLRNSEVDKGYMQYKDGKLYTQDTADIILSVNNENVILYPAANMVYNFDTKIPGFRSHNFWLPSMYEIYQIEKNLDIVNAGILKINGWETIDRETYLISSVLSSSYYSWFYHTTGCSDANTLKGIDGNGNKFMRAIPVSEIKI